MSKVRHFKGSELEYSRTNVDGAYTMICRAINDQISTSMGAGIETLDSVSIDWTVTYDEILFIKEGQMLIEAEGQTHHCREGDIVWLPNGTRLVYRAPAKCTYFYALFPVDWAKRQGTVEP